MSAEGHSLARAIYSSDRVDWCTPPGILERVRQLGVIGLDPCGNPRSVVGAALELQRERGEDGLAVPWLGRGLVFVNPPYGRRTMRAWAHKIASEGAAGAEIVALLPARTDAAWFRPLWRADALCFWRGRVRFLGATSGAPFPSVLTYHGPRVAAFAAAFGDAGELVQCALSPGGSRRAPRERVQLTLPL